MHAVLGNIGAVDDLGIADIPRFGIDRSSSWVQHNYRMHSEVLAYRGRPLDKVSAGLMHGFRRGLCPRPCTERELDEDNLGQHGNVFL